MQLNWKVIIGGGILMYIAQFIVSFITGAVIHEGILDSYYQATMEFWRPELNQDPPDMVALMPHWIATGLVMAFIMAGVFDKFRVALAGAGWLQGLKFGLVIALLWASFGAGYSGVFNLPGAIWVWWAVDGFIIFPVGGAVLGWFAGKFG